MQVQNILRHRLDLGLGFFRNREQLVLGSCSHAIVLVIIVIPTPPGYSSIPKSLGLGTMNTFPFPSPL
jgi:hypothetical protein